MGTMVGTKVKLEIFFFNLTMPLTLLNLPLKPLTATFMP